MAANFSLQYMESCTAFWGSNPPFVFKIAWVHFNGSVHIFYEKMQAPDHLGIKAYGRQKKLMIVCSDLKFNVLHFLNMFQKFVLPVLSFTNGRDYLQLFL